LFAFFSREMPSLFSALGRRDLLRNSNSPWFHRFPRYPGIFRCALLALFCAFQLCTEHSPLHRPLAFCSPPYPATSAQKGSQLLMACCREGGFRSLFRRVVSFFKPNKLSPLFEGNHYRQERWNCLQRGPIWYPFTVPFLLRFGTASLFPEIPFSWFF